MKQTIYAIEDDASLQEIYQYSLENEFDCRCFDSGEEFFDALDDNAPPDLVLLDVMLPGEDGFAILARLKEGSATAQAPVIMVSAKGDEVSKVKGLNMGASDYIEKPFGVLELIARIKANLRKGGKTASGSIEYKDISIDHAKRSVTANGAPIKTSLKEYNLMRMLCENAGKVQGREIIFLEVWGSSFAGESRTLDIHIKELRKKLAKAGSGASIQTVRGVGYMLT